MFYLKELKRYCEDVAAVKENVLDILAMDLTEIVAEKCGKLSCKRKPHGV